MERAILGIFAALGLTLSPPILSYILSPIFRIREDLDQSTQWAAVAPLSEVETAGETPKMFDVPYRIKQGWRVRETSRSVYAVRVNGELRLFSSFCTHLGCPTAWDETKKMIFCPCHGGLYNNTGEVIGGPPPRRLPWLNYKVENGTVYLEKPAETSAVG
jgi:Rieske Fe-S protein